MMRTMRQTLSLAIVVMTIAAPLRAQDAMKGGAMKPAAKVDSTKKKADAMASGMKHDGMAKTDAMKKDGMAKTDAMKHDGMAKTDAMKKDAMGKAPAKKDTIKR